MLWEVTKAEVFVVAPYAVVVPHSTVEFAAWSVIQMIVAFVELVPDTLIPLMSGGFAASGTSSTEPCHCPFQDSAATPVPWHSTLVLPEVAYPITHDAPPALLE